MIYKTIIKWINDAMMSCWYNFKVILPTPTFNIWNRVITVFTHHWRPKSNAIWDPTQIVLHAPIRHSWGPRRWRQRIVCITTWWEGFLSHQIPNQITPLMTMIYKTCTHTSSANRFCKSKTASQTPRVRVQSRYSSTFTQQYIEEESRNERLWKQ